MKTTLRALPAFTAISIFGAAVPAFAGDSEPLHVTVPFAFKAGSTTLPAGSYTVYSEGSHVIMIKGAGGNAIVLGQAGADVPTDKSGVSFEKDGADYCLKAVYSLGKGIDTRPGVSSSDEK